MRAILFALLATSSILAQSPPTTCATVSPAAAKLEFDAASVKPAGPFDPATALAHGPIGAIGGGPGAKDPGRMTGARVSLATLVMAAYGLDRDQVIGPDWMGDTMNKGFAVFATLPPTSTKEEYCGMLRNLLASRFHLTFRIGKQSRSGYELTLLPGGPKFKKYDPNAPVSETFPGTRVDANGFTILPPSQPTGGSVIRGSTGLTKETLRQDMAYFVRSLEDNINQSNGLGFSAPLPRIVNKTGLDGVYDIRLEFAGTPWNPSGTADPSGVGPSIFNAVQQQLGLKLTKVKDVPVDVLIIDHADQTPTAN